jgi:transcription antitermination protein NusB
MKGPRREGREMALQALYRAEVTGDPSPQAMELLWQHFEAPLAARGFAAALVDGVLARRDEIDALLADAAENWSLPRLSRVDLNVLRLAVYELLQRDPGVPTSVVLDEAIEIARRYGGEESSQFVNGVLDRVAAVLGVRDPLRHADVTDEAGERPTAADAPARREPSRD